MIVLGLAAGLLANMLIPGKRSQGLIITCVTGIAGALPGGWAATRLFHIHTLHGFFNLSTWLTVRGHEKVPVCGQVQVLAGGQVKVPIPSFVVSAGSLRPGRRRWRCQPVTVAARELPLKSARERMDVISAYREVGTYRGAAALSGTTPKTAYLASISATRASAGHAGKGKPLQFD